MLGAENAGVDWPCDSQEEREFLGAKVRPVKGEIELRKAGANAGDG